MVGCRAIGIQRDRENRKFDLNQRLHYRRESEVRGARPLNRILRWFHILAAS